MNETVWFNAFDTYVVDGRVTDGPLSSALLEGAETIIGIEAYLSFETCYVFRKTGGEFSLVDCYPA